MSLRGLHTLVAIIIWWHSSKDENPVSSDSSLQGSLIAVPLLYLASWKRVFHVQNAKVYITNVKLTILCSISASNLWIWSAKLLIQLCKYLIFINRQNLRRKLRDAKSVTKLCDSCLPKYWVDFPSFSQFFL